MDSLVASKLKSLLLWQKARGLFIPVFRKNKEAESIDNNLRTKEILPLDPIADIDEAPTVEKEVVSEVSGVKPKEIEASEDVNIEVKKVVENISVQIKNFFLLRGQTQNPTTLFLINKINRQEEELLSKMIRAMKVSSDAVLVMEIIDDSFTSEHESFLAYLKEINPSYIITMGQAATEALLLKNNHAFGALRGQWSRLDKFKVMPTWDPSVLIKQPVLKKEAWEDLKLVMKELSK